MEADGMKKLKEKQHNENKENFSTFFAIGNFWLANCKHLDLFKYQNF